MHIAYALSELHSTKDNRIHIEPSLMHREMGIELILDILMCIDILMNFLTSYQSEEGVWDLFMPRVIWNYAKGTMVFDIMSTLPCLFSDQSQSMYPTKLIRFIHVRSVFGFFSDLITSLFTKIGFNSSSTEKAAYIFNLSIILLTAIHMIACAWLYLGKTVETSWIDGGGEIGGGPIMDNSNKVNLYIAAFYWVITTLTTVGYGDFKGYTTPEFCFQMFVEFLGIGVFSFLMNAINELFSTEI
jgi:hypothetical protein